MSDKQTIGFIGIGNMGGPMAANLTRAGHAVHVFDSDSGRAKALAARHGAKAASTLGDLARAVDVVVTMLPTGHDVRHVFLQADNGALAANLKSGSLVLDMSSSDPVGTQELGAVLKQRGIVLLDAPVSGGVPRAIDGSLAIMIGGGDDAAIARAEPILLAMGKKLFRTGPLGSGHAMKALNNFVAATCFAASSEALIVGRRFGLDPKIMVDIMSVSTGRNFALEVPIKDHVLTGTYASGFTAGLLAKDVHIAADLAKAIGVAAPLIELVDRRWASARDEVGAEKDHTVAFKAWDANA